MGSPHGTPGSPNQLQPPKNLFVAANDQLHGKSPDKKDSPSHSARQLAVPASETKSPSSNSLGIDLSFVKEETKNASVIVNNSDTRQYPFFWGSKGLMTHNPLRWGNALINFVCEGLITVLAKHLRLAKLSKACSKAIASCYQGQKYCVSWFDRDDPWYLILGKVLLSLILIPLCLAAQIICAVVKILAISPMIPPLLTKVVTDAAVNFTSFLCTLSRDLIFWIESKEQFKHLKNFIQQNNLNDLAVVPVNFICEPIMNITNGILEGSYHFLFNRNDGFLSTAVKSLLFLPIVLTLGPIYLTAWATKCITEKTVELISWCCNSCLTFNKNDGYVKNAIKGLLFFPACIVSATISSTAWGS